MIEVVFESEEQPQENADIVTNEVLQKNIEKLHKQVFTKVRLSDNNVSQDGAFQQFGVK